MRGVINAPKTIWLQDAENLESGGAKRWELEGVTWCADQVSDGDVAYTRSDIADKLLEALKEVIMISDETDDAWSCESVARAAIAAYESKEEQAK